MACDLPASEYGAVLITSLPPSPSTSSHAFLPKMGPISAQVRGAGLDAVTVVPKKLVPESLELVIPVGTFFVNHSGQQQDMVAVYEATVHLTDLDTVTTTVRSACANLYRDVPDEQSTFDILTSPQGGNLQRLIATIQRGRYTHTVKQIAVWIVTDDVSRPSLDNRYRRAMFGSALLSSPAASDEDVIRALWLVQEAGIPIEEQTLFAERVSLVRALASDDAEVRAFAVDCLEVPPDGILAYLCACLEDDIAALREAAAATLGKLAEPDAVEPLCAAVLPGQRHRPDRPSLSDTPLPGLDTVIATDYDNICDRFDI